MNRRGELVTALVAGVIFAVGLALSGMTQPGKVEAFLDVGGGWDPALAAVMAGAIAVNSLAYLWRRDWSTPWLAGTRWHLPTLRIVDTRLVVGAVLFGVGWGVTGYCPGPAVMSLGTGSADIFLFVGSMTAGMFLFARAEHAWNTRSVPVTAKVTELPEG